MVRFPGRWLPHRLSAALVALAMMTIPALAAPFAALVMDARTGEVLYQENADARLAPASLTKMMTLYIAFQAIEHGEISLDTPVTISRNAASEPPSKLGLKPGQKIALRYLIRAAAIKSANDSATAIAEAIGGSVPDFAKRMNATAAQLGMKNSHFVVPHGLTTPGHLSSARDMTILGRHLFYDFPQYYNIFSRRSADAGVAEVYNTNRRFLDAYDGADGIKTGYTAAAGFNLTASAKRGDKRIIASVFGGQSTAWRNAKMAELLDLGFKRAPNSAPTTKPAPATYLASYANPGAVIANGDDSPSAAAKTLRLQVAVAQSMRPQPRPGAEPAPALVAMQSGIDAVLEQVQANAAAAPAAAPANAVASLAPVARPEDLVATAASDEAGSDEEAAEVAMLGTSEPELRPEMRPATPSETAAETNEAEPTRTMPATAVAQVEALDQLDRSVAAASPTAGPVPAQTGTIPFQTTAPQPETLELAAAMAPQPGQSAPPERPGMIMLVSAQPDGAVEPATDVSVSQNLEVVSRASTSGGHHWGINIGRYGSRFNAERALLQTALTEGSSLDGTLRKVVQTKTGFDATFVGMTEEMAQAACRRFTARGKECGVVGP